MHREEREAVIYEKEDAIARIILNQPENANAQSQAMVDDVEWCLTDAEYDVGKKCDARIWRSPVETQRSQVPHAT